MLKKNRSKNFCKVKKIDILFKQQLISSQSDSHAKSEELITSHTESEEIWKDGNDKESTAKVCNESSTDSNEDSDKEYVSCPPIKKRLTEYYYVY
jgi:hypothetical protein